MAELGIRKFDDLVGRADLLDTRSGIEHWKAKGLDFSKIFFQPAVPADVPRRHTEEQDHGLAKALDHKLIEQAKPALEKGQKVQIETSIINVNRTCGTMLSGEVAKRYGNTGLPDDTIHVKLTGTAGQAFGAFLARGVTLELTGEGNDYVGKGLSGGRIIIKPSADFRGNTQENIIVGNTVMYGATDGDAFLAGVGGERFAVRNSGGTAVVEGVGDHGCEYMTGGTVVVLGMTGRNFAAGMSGGIAYVLDEDGSFKQRANLAQVALEKVVAADRHNAGEPLHRNQADETQLKELITRHAEYTGSQTAKRLLADWEASREKFVKVYPHEYKRALTEIAAAAQKEAA